MEATQPSTNHHPSAFTKAVLDDRSKESVPTSERKDLVSRENRSTVGDITVEKPRMTCRDVNVYYGNNHAIKNVSLDIGRNEVLAMIGPSGCGKSTFIRCLNRMNDTIEGCRITGEIALDGANIYGKQNDVVPLRAQVGMVFQKPNPFPKSIYDNIAYGPRIHGLAQNSSELDEIVETSLKRAGLWKEVKDILDHPGTGLSGGQQQRLCIARTIAVSPEVILMDEPCSALDPIATAVIEDLIHELCEQFTIVIDGQWIHRKNLAGSEKLFMVSFRFFYYPFLPVRGIRRRRKEILNVNIQAITQIRNGITE